MKKQILSGFLAATIFSTCASAAFNDIKSDKLNQTVSVLNSFKIMQGDSPNTFSPDRSITRAEFSKLLVTMLGVTDVTAYKSYTIFPDVPNTHWAAGYINAAIRHPDLQKKNIIKGYADGTFKPNNTISYGEACTMLLLALGYTIEDIGPMWPNDYVARAESLGLSPQNTTLYANSVMSRENTAYMLLNTLFVSGKDNSGKLIDTLVSGSDSEGAILIATSKTDTDLRENQAKFYLNGEIITKNTEGTLDDSMIGMRGTLYYSKKNAGSVIAILPEAGTRTESYKVSSVQADKIETTQGTTIKPNRDTMVYLNGSVGKFDENWFNLLPNDEITLHYDSVGNITLIRTNARKAAENSFVYGTNTANPIPNDYKIIKNGVEIGRDLLKKYDVITIDTSAKTVNVSDNKLTGVYYDAKPAFKNPTKITMLGKEFNISEKLTPSFAKFKQGDKITLLLDNYGSVVDVYPASEIRAEMTGLFEKIDGTNAQIRLVNGMTIKGEITESDKKLVGKLVTASQITANKLSLIGYNGSGKKSGAWDIKAGKLGTTDVSPNVMVLEQVYDSAPIYISSIKQLPFNEIKSIDIRNTILDSSGNIVAIVLRDVSGDAWNYGYGYVSIEKHEGGGETFTVTLKRYDYKNNSQSTLTYNPIGRPIGIVSGEPMGLAKGAELNENSQPIDSIRLKCIATVSLADFDLNKGVKTSEGYYNIADEVQVYVKSLGKFITLNQAKADYKNFTLYAERTADNGGKIRVIAVS